MKKHSITKWIPVLIALIICWNCQKNEKIMISPVSYFRDMSDTTTTSIHVSIPRIDFLNDKNFNQSFLVYVSVTDQDGNVLAEFNENNFDLAYICKGDLDTIDIQNHTFIPDFDKRNHIAMGNIMDYSGSMSSQDILDMEESVIDLIRLKDEEDYMQIIKFHSEVFVMNEFTNDTLELINAVNEGVGSGSTAYYQAVMDGLDNAYDFTNIYTDLFPAIIAFAAGYNDIAPYDPETIIKRALKLQIPVYTVGYGHVNEPEMLHIADETGGRYFYTQSSAEISGLYTTISGQLSNIYGLTTQELTVCCDELFIILTVVYENYNGPHQATTTRSVFLDP